MAGPVRRSLALAALAGMSLLGPPAGGACTGDCDDSGAVSVDEVLRGVRIAIGTAALADCPAMDRDSSDIVEIDEILASVAVSLSTCQADPTPHPGCPAGRELNVGYSSSIDTFGRLQDGDVLPLRNFLQAGAEARFHVEARCLNTGAPVRVHARMESTAARHPILFDAEAQVRLAEEDDGFARARNLRFAIGGGGPFFDVQDAEGDLTVIATDADGLSASEGIRLRLTFTPHETELPHVDPTPAPTATPPR